MTTTTTGSRRRTETEGQWLTEWPLTRPEVDLVLFCCRWLQDRIRDEQRQKKELEMYEKGKAEINDKMARVADTLKPIHMLLQERIAKGRFALQAEQDPAKKAGMGELLTFLEDRMGSVEAALGLLEGTRLLILYSEGMGDILVDLRKLQPDTVKLIREAQAKGCRVTWVEKLPTQALPLEEPL